MACPEVHGDATPWSVLVDFRNIIRCEFIVNKFARHQVDAIATIVAIVVGDRVKLAGDTDAVCFGDTIREDEVTVYRVIVAVPQGNTAPRPPNRVADHPIAVRFQGDNL